MSTTIQDSGRIGLGLYGIPRSGAMDLKALQAANMLSGNTENAACFEFTMQGGHLAFHKEAMIGITGADMQWTLNGEEAGRFQSIEVKAGDVLKGGYSISGLRSYLSIQGQIDSRKDYDSYSTYGYAKLGQAQIKNGDKIEIKRDYPLIKNYVNMVFYFEYDAKTIEFSKGPEWDTLDDESKHSILNKSFKISPQSNRMGARLEGNSLSWKEGTETHTKPLLPGMIQLPPNGDPIVILQDGQITGGYPRIGYIQEEELWKFNQIQLAKEFNFVLKS